MTATTTAQNQLSRFNCKYSVNILTGCWGWIGAMKKNGYGIMIIARKEVLAHRVSYAMAKGKIPEGLQIDHLCRNRSCVNPEHLEAVTARINLLRGQTLAAKNLAKTHCTRGHEFTEENTYRRKDRPRDRGCRSCIALRSKAWKRG